MWRIFYDEDTGRIKYMIQAYGASPAETSAFIDVPEKVDINNKKIVNGAIVPADPPPVYVFPEVKPYSTVTP